MASLRAHHEILIREGAVDPAPGAALADAVKLRNLIGRAYGDVDPAKLHARGAGPAEVLEALCRDELSLAESRAAGG